MMQVHSSAWIDSSVKLPSDVFIGAGSIIEEGVLLSSKIHIGAHCHVYSGSTLEEGVRLFDGCIVGSAPQDRKYQGEESEVRIGKYTTLREYVTVNGGTLASKKTLIGAYCLIMAYTHIAHDCVVEDHVTLANSVQMGGHVFVGAHTIISGMTGIHQFSVIGPGCFVGGGRVVDKNILPFSKALGEPLTWAGINRQGLEKSIGLSYISLIHDWYRKTNRKDELFKKVEQWNPKIKDKKGSELKQLILNILVESKRGLLVPWSRKIRR